MLISTNVAIQVKYKLLQYPNRVNSSEIQLTEKFPIRPFTTCISVSCFAFVEIGAICCKDSRNRSRFTGR